MKNIEEIREKLGPDYRVEEKDGVITVCDIWDGVEFAECVSNNFTSFIHGEICPISMIDGEWIYTKYDEKLSSRNGLHKTKMKPSTEAAYVEQLKTKAKELYGSIKDGDRFDRSEMGFDNWHKNGIVSLSFKGWDYCKRDDKLFFGSICIYQQGKWAKKVDEPIRVNVSSVTYFRDPIEYMGELIPSGTIDCTVHFTIEGSSPKIILKDEFRQLLSKCLDDYLNKS